MADDILRGVLSARRAARRDRPRQALQPLAHAGARGAAAAHRHRPGGDAAAPRRHRLAAERYRAGRDVRGHGRARGLVRAARRRCGCRRPSASGSSSCTSARATRCATTTATATARSTSNSTTLIYRGAHNDYLSATTMGMRQRIAAFRRAQFTIPESAGEIVRGARRDRRRDAARRRRDRERADARRMSTSCARRRASTCTSSNVPLSTPTMRRPADRPRNAGGQRRDVKRGAAESR